MAYKYQKMSFQEIENIISKCNICVIGVSNANQTYLVPMYFEYDSSHDDPIFLLESKNTGQKVRYFNSNSKVCIFIQYNESTAYKSIIVNGNAFLCENSESEESNMVLIKVHVKEISGRIYHK